MVEFKAIAAGCLAALMVAGCAPGAQASCGDDALGVSRTMTVSGAHGGRISAGLEAGEVVLTFDDGPGGRRTRGVLRDLAEECVQATFFLRGDMAKRRKRDVQRIAAAGHSIGGHGWAHANLAQMPREAALADVRRGVESIETALDWKPKSPRTAPQTTLFRFPFVATTPDLSEDVRQAGFVEVEVTVDGRDWLKLKPEESVELIMAGLEAAGRKGVILLHDPFPDSRKRTRLLLARLKAEGYRIVALEAARDAEEAA